MQMFSKRKIVFPVLFLEGSLELLSIFGTVQIHFGRIRQQNRSTIGCCYYCFQRKERWNSYASNNRSMNCCIRKIHRALRAGAFFYCQFSRNQKSINLHNLWLCRLNFHCCFHRNPCRSNQVLYPVLWKNTLFSSQQ